MARQFGIETRSITLLPIGGVANLDRMPRRPLHELAVALAGPAVNVAIAGLLVVVLVAVGSLHAMFNMTALNHSFLIQLLWANVGLVLFNMLPVFPMDGGRVLRSLLAGFMPYVRATNIAATVGQVMAGLFVVLGLAFGQWMLLFVAVFVFLAGRAEAEMTRAKASIQGWSAGDAMKRQFHMVPGELTLQEAASAVLFMPQDDYPVIENNRLVGMLAKREALRLLAQGRGYLRVRDVMRGDVPTLDRHLSLEESLDQMQTGNFSSLPVADCGRLVGLLSADTLRAWMAGWTRFQPAVAERY
jgi:CBS domain-containing protein